MFMPSSLSLLVQMSGKGKSKRSSNGSSGNGNTRTSPPSNRATITTAATTAGGGGGNGHHSGGSNASSTSSGQSSGATTTTHATNGRSRGSASHYTNATSIVVGGGASAIAAAAKGAIALDVIPVAPSTASTLLENARSSQAQARFDQRRSLPLMIKKAQRYRDITCPRKKITVSYHSSPLTCHCIAYRNNNLNLEHIQQVIDGNHVVEVFGSLLDPKVVNGTCYMLISMSEHCVIIVAFYCQFE
jgi:hypothetical protein